MINIALDGPAGSGKSTVAKIIAKKLDILYLDTGAMYRACGLKCQKEGVSVEDEQKVRELTENIDLDVVYEKGAQVTCLDGEDVSGKIRTPEISMLASRVSAYPFVRVKMVEKQREIAASTDCVLDGRDIGTYVLPNAKYKFFVTADDRIRAERRYKELTEKGQKVDFDTLYEELKRRDYNDSHREFAPLKQADDAILIDTSGIDADEVAKKILSYVEER
ncbi:MAG: (d)CMP kinase [Clostridia bacterium]|nr:(d)CMP kinase [Clostridia bacterium]